MLVRIVEELRRRRRERGALPSVRELAREFAASPQTVHKALRRLAADGLVHSIDRKGFFWGSAEGGGPGPSAEGAEERFRIRFHSDLRQGTYHPWKELPTRQALAQVYGVGTRAAGRVLDDLASRGVLERHGRRFFPAPAPVGNRGATSVLLVVRCDPRGEILLDTERETDFLKAVRRELSERGLGFRLAGYDGEGPGRFLDRGGSEIEPSRIREPLLGVVVSTWLVPDPVRLLGRLAALGRPISAWWEHPAALFPRKGFPAGLAGFNLSFGESTGSAMGRYLASLGRRDVAYISPYHDNEWSQARLRGLRDHLQACGGSVREFVDPGVYSPWDLLRTGGRALLERTLRGLLESPGLAETRTWVFANDLAAAAMHRILRGRSGPRPFLTGFDNSSESEKLGFDSFEFHTEGMARLMLHHLVNPRAEIFSSRTLHEMIGRLVVRTEPGG